MKDNLPVDRTELIRKVTALPRTAGDILGGSNTNENSLRSYTIFANTMRETECWNWAIGGYGIIAAAGTVTVRLKFAGNLLLPAAIVMAGAGSAIYYGHGHIMREGTSVLGISGVVFRNDVVNGQTTQILRGEITAQDFTIDNIFEVTMQKSVAGDTAANEIFLAYKHPRI